MTLVHIIAATLLCGFVSVLAAAWLSMSVLRQLIPQMVSLSVGVLLSTAILQLLPEAFESGESPHGLAWALLLGVVGFFALEKVAVLRHSHHHEGDGHGHHHGHDRQEAGPAGLLILVGNSVHNFADGVLTAASFLIDIRLGWITTLAIAAHEIPQEIGDFIVMLNAGYTRTRAFAYNLVSGLASVGGGVIGYFVLQDSQRLVPYAVAVASASFIYIALADVVPDMHRKTRHHGEAIRQFVWLVAGIGVVAVIAGLTGHHH